MNYKLGKSVVNGNNESELVANRVLPSHNIRWQGEHAFEIRIEVFSLRNGSAPHSQCSSVESKSQIKAVIRIRSQSSESF